MLFSELHFRSVTGPRGSIEVICGSMFSGKTEELIRRLRRAQIAKLNVEILTALNGTSTIRFTLPEEGLVSLDLYNIVGQKVRALVSNESYSSGIHYLNYNFSGSSFEDISTGIYFYRLTYNNKIKTSKISVLR